MRKPTVSYRGFTPRKLFYPEYRHLCWLGGWILYFCLYFLTENLIPAEHCTPVHMWLDDVIPFCEFFVIPYVLWYGLIVISLGYFALYNTQSFKDLSKYIFITQMVAMAIYILFPTRQDLRPETFVNDNFLTRIVGLLYSADTNTGVCPSLHCAYSIGIFSVWCREKGVSLLWKTFVGVFVISICLSTMFIKQHSAVDFFAALPVCLLAEGLVYGKRYLQKLKVRKE